MRDERTGELSMTAQHTIAISSMLRAFLPRISKETSEAWTLMIMVERFAPIQIWCEESKRLLDADYRTITIPEVRSALICIARESGPNDWPSSKMILDALRKEREKIRREQMKERMQSRVSVIAGLLPEQGTVTDETRARTLQKARETLSMLKDRMTIARLEDDTAPTDTIGKKQLQSNLDAANRRRAELRKQFEQLMSAEEHTHKTN